MWVIEITYFEFYCKFHYFYEHLELNMIFLTKYLDNLRPFTKQVKNDKGKRWKKFEADVWKISFSLTFDTMESYYPQHQLVYYNLLKKFISLARVVNFRYSFNARTPVLLQMIFVDR